MNHNHRNRKSQNRLIGRKRQVIKKDGQKNAAFAFSGPKENCNGYKVNQGKESCSHPIICLK